MKRPQHRPMKLGNHMPKKLREQARKGTPDKPAPICRWCGFAVVPEDAQIRHCPARDGDFCEPVRAAGGRGGTSSSRGSRATRRRGAADEALRPPQGP